jgi:hypothetical protein
MWLRLFQIVLFVGGVFAASFVLSLADDITGPAVFAIGVGAGFITAGFGTWVWLRFKHGKKAPTLRDLLVDTLHRIG